MGTVDIVKYEVEKSEIYLNGEKVSETITESSKVEEKVNSTFRAKRYSYVGSKKKRISWGKATSVAILAAMIAAAVGSLGGTAVIGAMGIGTLGALAGASGGGTVKTKIYSLKAGKITNYKYVWSFTASTGDRYGNYTSYITV